jgi:hypothetical protein
LCVCAPSSTPRITASMNTNSTPNTANILSCKNELINVKILKLNRGNMDI